MTRRSAMHDRYRVAQKGSTRKSAASAKPKREAGAGSTSKSSKPSKGSSSSTSDRPKGWRGLLARGGSSQPTPRIPQTPELRRLRRWWWTLLAVALASAVASIPALNSGNRVYYYAVIGVYIAAIGGVMYIEFGPQRRARVRAMELARKAKSGSRKSAVRADSGATQAGAGESAGGGSAEGGEKGSLLSRAGGVLGGRFKKKGDDGE